MKNKLKLLGCLIGLVAAVGICLAAASSFRRELESTLTGLSRRPVRIRSAYLTFPPGIRLIGVEVLAVPGEARPPLRIDSLAVRPGGRPRERRFTLSGHLEDEQGKALGRFNAQGTFFREGPVDAQIALTYPDLSRLSAYLRQVLGAAPDRGAMEMKTRLTLFQEVLMAHNEVTATGVSFPSSELTTLGLDGNRLVQLLKDKEGKVHLSFIVAGKLGEKLDWSDLAAGAMREAMRQAMSRSILQVMSETEQKKPVEELMRRKLDTLDR